MQNNLRAQYPEFIFESYSVEDNGNYIRAKYTYRLGEHVFTPSVKIPSASIRNEDINWEYLEHLLFNFGIINGINYYKLAIPQKYTIKCGALDDTQKAFFTKLFYNGLGEFMYVNNIQIPYQQFMYIDAPAPTEKPRFDIGTHFSGNLIPVGGGKDSAVTLEALQSMHQDNLCLQYNRNIYPQNIAAINCIKHAGYTIDKIVDFDLELDQHMLELNTQGFLNGHIPFSSCLAFAGVIMAYLNNKKYIVLSNEASANEGNITGTNINHQYSKSFEFECDFRNYCKNYLSDQIEYFSLLRCMNEYQIVQKFIKFPVYFDIFRSCNVGTKENKWCGHCAKCLYVYLMIYPYLSADKLQWIFGNDIYNDPSLVEMFAGLVSPNITKPFECVGTEEEVNFAVKTALENAYVNSHKPKLPVLLEYYKNNFYKADRQYNVVDYYNPQHNIPQNYIPLIVNL